MLRRTFLLSVAAVAFGCTQQQADTTIQGIIDAIKNTCNFVVSVQNLIPVINTIITGFNATAGASATVITAVATQVENLVCNAVKAQVAQLKAEGKLKAAAPGDQPTITVVVNGVNVPGTYTGS